MALDGANRTANMSPMPTAIAAEEISLLSAELLSLREEAATAARLLELRLCVAANERAKAHTTSPILRRRCDARIAEAKAEIDIWTRPL